jgi:hypothetical protein
MSVPEDWLAAVHHHVIRGLLDEGTCPGNTELASRTGIDATRVEETLRELEGIHGVVLHPHECRPWVAHPFSLAPTVNWVQGPRRGWWAPCVWCALGVATLAGGECTIHSRIAGETEPVEIIVWDGVPAAGPTLWVHFAIPPARAWDNVHLHCSLVLPFRGAGDTGEWCERHGFPQGEAVPLHQVAELARVWYGRHADRDWRKWTVTQAQEIFAGAGLKSEFWDLGARAGKF